MNRRLLYVTLGIVLVFVGAAIYEFTKPATLYGSHIEPPKPMPDFTLQAVDGPLTLSSFRGKYVVLYFGYTSCPDICPTISAALKAALGRLGDQQAQVQVVFVSVDHKRDTPAKVASYIHNFSPDFVGLTGTKSEIDQVTREFGIYYQLNDPDSGIGSYLVDHTATILLLDRQGALVMTWAYGQQPDEIASDLKTLMRK